VVLSDYAFSVAKGPTASPNDFGITAVLDGSLLKLTPLRNANVPPPMALHELKLQQDAIDVAISQSSTQLAVLDRGKVVIYSYSITSKSVQQPECHSEHPLPQDCDVPVQVAWRGENEVFVLTHDAELNQDAVYVLNCETLNWVLVDVSLDHVSSIVSSQSYSEVYIQSSLGLVTAAPSGTEENLEQPSTKLPVLCPWVETVVVGDEVSLSFLRINLLANEIRT
jgi:elongator complex protein 1